MQKHILAIDLGTSGPKVAIVSTTGQVMASEIEETQLILSHGGGAEQDPADWWSAIARATRRLMESRHVPVESLAGIGVTAQWSGTVCVDAAGKHLSHAVIWMDSRGADYVKKLTRGLIQIQGYGLSRLLKFIRLTGGAPGHSGKDSIAHILYIQATNPSLYADTYKFLEPKDFLNLKLTGKFAATFDSIALHWLTDNRNINEIAYHDGLVSMAGIDRAKLPDLKRSTDIIGVISPQAAAELGLPENLPVIGGTPDIQSAAIGSGAVRDFEAHLYIGTSSWLTCHVPFKKTDLLHNMATLPSAIPGRYFIANEQETAGYCLTYLRDKIFYAQDSLGIQPAPKDAYVRMTEAAASVPPGSDSLIFTPWLYGERTPIEDHSVRGAFYNQSLSTTRAHMIRAVLEGVAFNSKWLLGAVESFMKRRAESINVIGGGARSALWCQILADVFDRTIRQVHDPVQANSRGVGLLAAAALGLTTFEEISAQIPVSATYRPNSENRAVYDSLFKEFKNIYKQNKSIYGRLNP
ncbi:MAG TPA: FGGY-family carbohydrate kinase [Leptospiraceae bacterium]|nr:FGGY-family carbohydrate kinase [Leptospirales bacterium]HMW60053.1 FGGY-family carbohydrate kinase [Leptospiraceae bacterium]HMX58017.1 FGGY-family carbohydrate kinase [Leptospiraceae bacterium]HMZ37326.1 FGGY-family carbohydrate kinase [Leptospiraceae bacterium]HNE23769.1 FGGY-family carbohydrate kinase [Leptospiraceae bacterium]